MERLFIDLRDMTFGSFRAFGVSLRRNANEKVISADRAGLVMKMVCILWLALNLLPACLTGTAQEPANMGANEKAKAILKYFQSLEPRTDRRLVTGQFTEFGGSSSLRLMNRIHDETGQWPAILGADYSNGVGLTHTVPNRMSLQYWKQGGLVTISAHLYNPSRTNAGGGGLKDKGVDLNALLAKDTEVHARWMAELDQMVDGLEELKDAGVVVLWRPFHEMNGDWFWWGAKDPAAFIKLWQHMFDYFSKTKHLDNLLWVYSPNQGANTAAYYPGDAYVDLIGLDAYTDFIDTNHIQGYPEIAKIKKPFGFTEYGPHAASNPPGDYDYRRFLEGVQRNFPRTVFFMSWNAKWSLASNTNVAEVLNSPYVVNRGQLPKGLAGQE
jgi:mannan endo-1,4-beta-mannosidase